MWRPAFHGQSTTNWWRLPSRENGMAAASSASGASIASTRSATCRTARIAEGVDAATLPARLVEVTPGNPAAPNRVAAEAPRPPEIAAPIGSDDAKDLLQAPPVPAAVLVPFVLGLAPGVLLTKRNARMNKHAGQVSFPGGRIDATDPTPE